MSQRGRLRRASFRSRSLRRRGGTANGRRIEEKASNKEEYARRLRLIPSVNADRFLMAGRLRLFFFLLFVSYGAFLPFFPTWLSARGVRGVEMSALMALGPALGVLGPPAFGALSDWLGLRAGLLRIATAGGLLAMLLLAVPGALGAEPALPLLFVAMLLFSTSRAPAVAMTDVIAVETAQIIGPDGKTRSYGSIRLAGSLGFMVSALVVGRALDVRALAPLPLLLVVSSLVTFGVSFALNAKAPPRAQKLKEPLGRLLRDRAFVMLLLSAFIGFGAHSSYDICFSLHVQKLGVGADWVGLAWAIGTLAETGLFAWSGRLLGSGPVSRWLVVAFAGGAVRWALIATVRNTPLLLALQPLHAVSFALFWVTSIELVRRLSPKEILATAQGVFNAAVGGGAVVGMLVWGTVFERYGGAVTFAWASAAAGCAALAAAGTAGRASRPEVL